MSFTFCVTGAVHLTMRLSIIKSIVMIVIVIVVVTIDGNDSISTIVMSDSDYINIVMTD